MREPRTTGPLHCADRSSLARTPLTWAETASGPERLFVAEAQDPGFLALSTIRRSPGVRPGAPAKRGASPPPASSRAKASAFTRILRAVEDFVVAPTRADLVPEKRGIDLGDHRRCIRRPQAGLEGPHPGTAGDARIRLQALERGQAQQHLRADGAGIGQLPDGLGALRAMVRDAALRRVVVPPRRAPRHASESPGSPRPRAGPRTARDPDRPR